MTAALEIFDPAANAWTGGAYDPRTNTWQSLTPMATPTHGLNRAVFLDGRIHVPGGAVTLGGNTGSTLHQVHQPERRCDQ